MGGGVKLKNSCLEPENKKWAQKKEVKTGYSELKQTTCELSESVSQ